jgi:hypothetical protein
MLDGATKAVSGAVDQVIWQNAFTPSDGLVDSGL